MSRLRVLATVAALITGTALGVVSPAWAAAPSNDTSAGATAASDGFSEVLDTTEATTDAQDVQFFESCGGIRPFTRATVWYTIEGTGTDIVVDNAGNPPPFTNYQTFTLVGVGSPGSLQGVACGFSQTSFFAELGTTYYVLVADDGEEANNGGTLNISFRAVPPPTLEITLDANGTANKATGTARIGGTYTCTAGNTGFRFIGGSVTQTIKQRVPVGTSASFEYPLGLLCDGVRRTWGADAIPGSGAFRAGVATVDAFAYVCEIQCTFVQVTRNVSLAFRR